MDRFRIHEFDVLESTQIEARKPEYSAGDVIIAATQTGGYGRRGRTWQGPTGNLYMTMREAFTGHDQLSWLGYAVGLALYDAIQPLLKAQTDIQVKWPNDLLINSRKMTGILLEVEDDTVLIGIGMNIAVTPETDQLVTKLNDHTSEPYTPLDIVKAFLIYYQRWVELGEQGGFAAMRDTWLGRAAFKNQLITARLANGTVLTGIFADINQDGALVLQGENRHDTVTTADIYLIKEEK